MVWKIPLAAAAAAFLAPVAQWAHGGPSVEVSAQAWTGASQVVAVAPDGLKDPAFVVRLRSAAESVCTPANQSLRNAAREQACVIEALAGAYASLGAP